jgi:4-amino-4-deoxy-L-arabinose transferase-like glycosyltransferase
MAAFIVVNVWLSLINSSLWLDEAGTWWIVKDGWREVVQRATDWTAVSPLYYLVVWGSSKILGLSEWSMRIPSLLALTASIYFLYRIAEKIYDRSSAVVVALIYLCMVCFWGIDARPYALGLLGMTASTWGLMRWLEQPRFRTTMLYVISAALVIHANCILGLGLIAAGVYAIVSVWPGRVRLAQFCGLFVGTGLLCIPLIGAMRVLYGGRSAHTTMSTPTGWDMFQAFVPGGLAGACVLAGAMIALLFRKEFSPPKCSWKQALLISLWAFLPPLVLLLLPLISELYLLLDRYYSSSFPGQALLLGGLVSSFRHGTVRKALLIAMTAMTILMEGTIGRQHHGSEDWRGAMRFITHDVAIDKPVLFVGPFAEATDFKAMERKDLKDILFAPEAKYGRPGRTIHLPHVFNSEAPELDGIVRELRGSSEFYFLNDKQDDRYLVWLSAKLGERCHRELIQKSFGAIWIAKVSCAAGH